jgi:hypothetical protein
MDIIPIDSSAIQAVGYDPLTQRMRITFAAGHSYDYYGVPRHVFEGLVRAKSKGTFYNDHIRDRYGVEPSAGRDLRDVAHHSA